MSDAAIEQPPEGTDTKDLARKTTQGVVWNYAAFGLAKALQFITTAILARLLTPAEFGIVALANIAIDFMAIFKEMGLGAALIQRRDSIEEASDTVFTLNLILGVVLTSVTFLLAGPVAAFFNEPQVVPVLRVLSLFFLFNSLSATHIALLKRELDFRKKMVPDVGRAVFKGIVAISLALGGAGVWALVLGQVTSALAAAVLAWFVLKFRPKLSIDRTLVGGLFGFGISIFGIDAINIVLERFDYIIVGRVLGETQLGIYTLAYKLPEITIISLLWVMGAVIFPTYSKVQDDPPALKAALFSTARFMNIIAMPICLGFVIVAEPVILVAFGPQWVESIPILRVLAVYAWMLSVGFHIGGVYKAIGRPDIEVRLAVVALIALVPALLFGVQYGLMGVALGHLGVAALRAVMRITVATRFVGFKVPEYLKELIPGFMAGIALAVLAVPTLLLTNNWAAFPQLVAVATAGGVGYLGTLWLVEKDNLIQAAEVMGLKLPAFLKGSSDTAS